MSNNRKPTTLDWPDDHIILYDGVCVLCSGWIRFVARRDKNRLYRFTPISSAYGTHLAKALHIDPANPDTNAVVINGMALHKSDAVLAVICSLPGWSWVSTGLLCPRWFRNWIYDRIALNRYALFGKNETCDLGGELLEGRVLELWRDQ